ncbi:hypothetical protein HF673_06490 [Acidithiobacillus thiooxidans]|uniref:hypothetical protein n=1 Tax=Acidithiobacillus thiooxidans TaxID=930 RepID=UPI001C06B61E|nr:hypothetical protein [Acidithiobacillus thiooxidans]MBU2835444.1 hypothetical protein [Acidithiobacillus thiooxidans]
MNYEAEQYIAKRNEVESVLSIRFNTKHLEDVLMNAYECGFSSAPTSYRLSMMRAAPYAIVYQPENGWHQLINLCGQTFCDFWNQDGLLVPAQNSSRGFYLYNEPHFLRKVGNNYYLFEENAGPWVSQNHALQFLDLWQRLMKFFEWELMEVHPPIYEDRLFGGYCVPESEPSDSPEDSF